MVRSRFKVDDPAIVGSLCDTCKYSTFRRAQGSNRVIIICNSGNFSGVGGPVRTRPMDVCTDYRDRNSMDLYDMKKIAWKIDNSQKEKIGFIKPSDLERAHAGGPPKEFEELEFQVDPRIASEAE